MAKRLTMFPFHLNQNGIVSSNPVSFSDTYQLDHTTNDDVIITHCRSYPFDTVVIYKTTNISPPTILPQHDHLLPIREVFKNDGDGKTWWVFSWPIITFKQMESYRPDLALADIAEICRGAIKALHHLHSVLRLAHGSLSETNLCFSRDGIVQIGPIQECFRRPDFAPARIRDYQFLRTIFICCLEPEKLIERERNRPAEVGLAKLYDNDVHDFLDRLNRREPLKQILTQHKFLKRSGGRLQLRHMVDKWLHVQLPTPRRDEPL